MSDYKQKYEDWLNDPCISDEDKEELRSIAGDEKEIEDRFYKDLEFGTGGLRGIIGNGTNRINVYTIRKATQGLANYINKKDGASKGVSIAYDSRRFSEKFAREAASVLNGNGIRTYLFSSLTATPELSFAVRQTGSIAGIVITASHNPPEYNGYKVYWEDGAQVTPPHDTEIIEEVGKVENLCDIKLMDETQGRVNDLFHIIGYEMDDKYVAAMRRVSLDDGFIDRVADDFRIVYTPFHGCGYKLVPEALKRLGMKHVFPVPEQMVIDGNFPTVVSPNPENPEGFYLAVDLAKKVDSDLIIGTDPDSDRVGTMVRGEDGEYVTITGNQMGVLLLDYVIQARKETGSMPPSPGTVCSLVSTPMARTVAEKNGVHFEDTFTGFKFMAERIGAWEAAGSYQYIFAFEESYGYMVGDYVRDKDAVTISMLIAEMAAWYHAKGMSLLDAIHALYEKYGWYMEKTLNLVMPGVDGLEKMQALMKRLRATPPEKIGGEEVIRVRDYLDGSINVMGLGKVDHTPYFGSNVLYFELADGSIFIVRPSGTEPKIKVYLLVRGESEQDCKGKIDRYYHFAEELGK